MAVAAFLAFALEKYAYAGFDTEFAGGNGGDGGNGPRGGNGGRGGNCIVS